MDQIKLTKYMMIACIVMSVVFTSIIGIYVSVRKVDAQDADVIFAENELGANLNHYGKRLIIPLKEGYNRDNVIVEHKMLERCTSVFVGNTPSDFYKKNELTGNGEHVSKLSYGMSNNIVRIDIALDGVYECVLEYTENALEIEFLRPKELYKHIIVLSPGHGGEDTGTVANGVTESEVNLKLAHYMKSELENAGFGVYMTRENSEENPAAEDIGALLKNTEADMLFEIHCNGDAATRTTKGLKIAYCGENSYPASVLGEKINAAVIKTERDAIAEKTDFVMLFAGYLTNKEDAMRLSDDDELSMLASGCADALVEIMEGSK